MIGEKVLKHNYNHHIHGYLTNSENSVSSSHTYVKRKQTVIFAIDKFVPKLSVEQYHSISAIVYLLLFLLCKQSYSETDETVSKIAPRNS